MGKKKNENEINEKQEKKKKKKENKKIETKDLKFSKDVHGKQFCAFKRNLNGLSWQRPTRYKLCKFS